MKKSIAYLPEQKQDDLRSIVKYTLEVLPDCEMIILYGSYAKNTYVDYDQRIEYGVPTCFRSDYDILVVTRNRFNSSTIGYLLSKIEDRYYEGRSRLYSTSIQFISESINDLNKAIDKSRYFYTDIKKEGIMLYDSGHYKLARRRKLNFLEIKELAEEFYHKKFGTAISFLRSVKHAYDDQDYKIASFYLHQVCEHLYHCITLTFSLHNYKEHNLSILSCKAKVYSLESSKAFPRNTEEEERLFQLLVDAYVQARYNTYFVITKEDIETLIPKVALLRDITQQCCEERIREYEARRRK